MRQALPSCAAGAENRRLRVAGAGTVSGNGCPSFRASSTIAPSIDRPTSLHQSIDFRLSDQAAWLVQLGAQPAHHYRRVGQLALLELVEQAPLAAQFLLGLE